MLPSQQEPHEVLCRERLEGFGARPLRVAVHPRKQASGYPLRPGGPTGVAALQRETLSLQRQQTQRDLVRSQGRHDRQSFGSRYAAQLQVTAQYAGDRGVLTSQGVACIRDRFGGGPKLDILVVEERLTAATFHQLVPHPPPLET